MYSHKKLEGGPIEYCIIWIGELIQATNSSTCSLLLMIIPNTNFVTVRKLFVCFVFSHRDDLFILG